MKNEAKPKATKIQLHERNKHRNRYDFDLLTQALPELAPHVFTNKYGDQTIKFSDGAAVKALNAALLKAHYGIDNWTLPKGYLCPPIPSRADYLHYVVDLLQSKGGQLKSSKITCLDVGTGANCIYPLIGASEYGWTFIGSEIDKVAIQNAKAILNHNPTIKKKVELRYQENPKEVFSSIVGPEEYIDLVICNPPFFSSQEEATKANLRKVKNLTKKEDAVPNHNFGGQNKELWCEGGELFFILNMIKESKAIGYSCFYFTSLVSKKHHLDHLKDALKRAKAEEVKVIPMSHGHKDTRILAWSFLDTKQQALWSNTRWT